jgi:hypothetical protein
LVREAGPEARGLSAGLDVEPDRWAARMAPYERERVLMVIQLSAVRA